jgi:DMSO/TMAO reductase YedYZ molybdopterin-dependent catalytic subunit
MPLFRSKVDEKLREAGYDPARAATRPVPDRQVAGPPRGLGAEHDLATWDFRVFGEVEDELVLDWEQFLALPATEVTTDIHCVTRWSRFDARFKGVHWSELAKLVRPKPTARFVVAHAEQGFTANVPLEALEDPQALWSTRPDGEPLTPEHGWPLRLFDPDEVLLEERQVAARHRAARRGQPGFWERYGYNNNADYWNEERYEF